MSLLRRIFSLPFFPVVISPLLLFAPTILSGRALFWGTPSLQFVPWWSFAWESILSGTVPLWNPYVGMGAPLIANYQSAIFYPPNWFYFLLYIAGDVPLMAWGQAVMIAAQLAFAGVGMVCLIRKLGLGVLAQALAGLAFGLSGYLVARAGFLSITSTIIWLPWILLIGFRLVFDETSIKDLLLLGGTLGLLLLAGHAQTAWYSVTLLFLWISFWAWRVALSDPTKIGGRFTVRSIGRAWVGLTIAGCIGVAIAAVQLIPTLEYLGQSQRASAVDFEFAMNYSFWPWRFLTLLAPDMFGTPTQSNYWGYAAFWEDAVYIGILPLFMALRVIIRAIWPRREDQEITPAKTDRGESQKDLRVLTFFLLGIVVVAFILALGDNTPIFPWLYRNVPGFDMFQAPTRQTIWAITALVILAAIGVDGWGRPEGRGLYWTRLGTAGMAAVALVALVGWIFVDVDRNTIFLAIAKVGLWGFLIGVLSLRGPERETPASSSRWAWVVTTLVVADLLIAGWGLNPDIDRQFYALDTPAAEEVGKKIGEGRLYISEQDEYDLKFERFFRFDDYLAGGNWMIVRTALLPNIHMLDGFLHTANFDPLWPDRYSQWMDLVNTASGMERQKLLNLSAVSVVESSDLNEPFGISYAERPDTQRFVWFTCAQGVTTGEEALELLSSPTWEPSRALILEGISKAVDHRCESESAEILLKKDLPNQTAIEVLSDADGWLYLADTWYPGWAVLVDGEPADLLQANFNFMAVAVPKGERHVEFVYNPASFRIGTLISLIGIVALILAALIRYRRELTK